MDVPRHSYEAPSALLALLALVDAPALLFEAEGRVLGGNRPLLALAGRLELSVLQRVSDLVPGFEGPEPDDSGRASDERELRLRDGSARRARMLRLPGERGRPLFALAFDTGGQGAAARLRTLRHDLAGPLTAILGTAELLLVRERGLDAETRRGLEEVLAQCGRISERLAHDRALDEGGGEAAP